MKKRLSTVRREFKNRDYTEEEVLVREATSNSEDMPSATLLDKIGKVMLRLPTYTDAFEMLWRRLCHLEYRRHVFKALCVLDHLMRVNAPNSTVQLALVVDTRDRWADISRLGALRLEALGADTGQIRSLALRICQFVCDYEKSPNFSVNRERLRVKRKQTIIEPREQRSGEEVESKWPCLTCGFANSSRLQSCIMCENPKEGSPMKARSPSPVSPAHSSQWWWACARCSFVNTRAGFTNSCEMCRSQRTVKILGDSPGGSRLDKLFEQSPQQQVQPQPEYQSPVRSRPVWQCTWCTFTNVRLTSEPCEACSKTSIQVLAEAEHDAANLKLTQQKLREAGTEQELVEQLIRRLTQELVSAERKLKEAQEVHRRLAQQERETNEVRNACRRQAIEQARQMEACGADIAQRMRVERRDIDREKELEEKDKRAMDHRKHEQDMRVLKERLELERLKQAETQKQLSTPASSSSAPFQTSPSSPVFSGSSPSRERNDIEAIKQAAKDRIANLKQKQSSANGVWGCTFCHFSNPGSTSQCEVCKQTQSWVCQYCQANNTNAGSACTQCNRDSGSKVVMHYYTPPTDTQPKGWLCPFCRTVNGQSAEACKTCDHRRDLAPPAYGGHTPPTVFKDIHPPAATTSASTSSTFAVENPPSSFSSSSAPTKIPRPSSPPVQPSPVNYSYYSAGSAPVSTTSFSSSSCSPANFSSSNYTSSQLPRAALSSSQVSSSSTSAASSVPSPSPYVSQDRQEPEHEGVVGIQRQLSALSSFDSFFDQEEGVPATPQSFSGVRDREPASIFEQLSSGSNAAENPAPEKPSFDRPRANEPPQDASLWTCSQCAYINDRGKAHCDVCNQPKN